MADRYWRGGTASWDGTAGTKWADSPTNPGGASVPTTADDVYFDATSTGTCTIATGNTGAKSINCTGFTGTITGSAAITVAGSVTLVAGMTYTHTGTMTFTGTGTLVTAGKTFSGVTVDGSGITLTLGDALNIGSRNLTVTQGSFATANYNVTASSLVSNNSNTRSITLGSSTVTVSAVTFTDPTNLTFNAGTSTITRTVNGSVSLDGGSQTFYNVSYAAITSGLSVTVSGTNTFNNFSVTGRNASGIDNLTFSANQTINGTLTVTVGTNATMRRLIRSDTIGTTRTLTCNAVATLTDVDFRDIAFAGNCVSGGNLTGTRLGNCLGNTGITFDAGVPKYWNLAAGGNWSATGWATGSGGTPAVNNFPLAQDTCIFEATGLNSGATVTVNANYNIGDIDMSARTTNTMTLATGTASPQVYGSWTNGTGTTLSGTIAITFAGRSSHTITSAGKTFTQPITVVAVAGTYTLQDAFTTNGTLTLTAGTLNANIYNVTCTTLSTSNSNTRTLALGSGTWTLTSNFTATTSTNLTVTGTGTISLTSASSKTFNGGGIQTYPTLNQGGTGQLTINGANKFANITNTAVGSVLFQGGTTNEFTAFNLSGSAGNLLTLGSTDTTQATLIKETAWLMGANSVDSGNNTGLSFTAGGGIDYLNVSYINGQLPAILAYIQESLSASDALAVGGTYTAPVSETATANDAVAAGLFGFSLLAETATAADSVAAFKSCFAALSESATAQDQTAVAASTFNASSADTATAQDAPQGANTGTSSVAESAEVLEQAAAQFCPSAGISEQVTASETASALMVFASRANESSAASDSASVAPSTFSAAAAAVAAVLDSGNAPGSIYNAALPTEGATAVDSIIGAYLWNLIDDAQNPNWQNINTPHAAGWQPIDTAQPPGWTEIPTVND